MKTIRDIFIGASFIASLICFVAAGFLLHISAGIFAIGVLFFIASLVVTAIGETKKKKGVINEGRTGTFGIKRENPFSKN